MAACRRLREGVKDKVIGIDCFDLIGKPATVFKSRQNKKKRLMKQTRVDPLFEFFEP